MGRRAARTALVIGAGPNGLVAANLLADAGWSVHVLEAQHRVGGAVASDDDVAEGFVHDTFSSFYPLGAASPVISHLLLEAHGLRWRHAPAVLGHPLPTGSGRCCTVTSSRLPPASTGSTPATARPGGSCIAPGRGSGRRWSTRC